MLPMNEMIHKRYIWCNKQMVSWNWFCVLDWTFVMRVFWFLFKTLVICQIMNGMHLMEAFHTWPSSQSHSFPLPTVTSTLRHTTFGANASLWVRISLGRENVLNFIVKFYQHRSWNCLCLSYDSKTRMNKLFMNGMLQGSKKFHVQREVLGSVETFDAVFFIGQEPD